MSDHLSIIPGQKNGTWLFHCNDGFFFHTDKQTDTALYLRCSKFRAGCTVRGIWRLDGSFHFYGVHSDEPDWQQIPYRIERQKLLVEARRLDIHSFREIFQSNRIHNEGLTLHRLYPAMNRTRMQALPQLQNIIDLIGTLENPAYACVAATASNDFVYRGSVETTNGSHIILFMSQTCIEFLRIVPTVFIAHVSIFNEYVVLTIGAFWKRDVLSLGWWLMDAFGHLEIFTAFSLLKTTLGSWHFKRGICGDCMVSLAFCEVFEVPLCPSLYDIVNDIRRCPEEHTQNHGVVKLCCALSLLPKDLLQCGIGAVWTHVQALGAIPSNNIVLLFQYMDTKWLRDPNFTVCGQPERTHFGCEIIKSEISNKFSNFDGNLYSITKFMVAMSDKAHSKIQNIASKGNAQTRTPPPLLNDPEVLVALEAVLKPSFSQAVSVLTFLQVVSRKIP